MVLMQKLKRNQATKNFLKGDKNGFKDYLTSVQESYNF